MKDNDNATQAGVVVNQAGETQLPGVPARIADALPGKLLLLPLPNRPFFPAQTMPIVIPDEPWRETIERVGNTPPSLARIGVRAGPRGRNAYG